MRTKINLLSFIFLLIIISCTKEKTDTISIENVNLIPMNEEVVLKQQRVVIKDGKIIRIERNSKKSDYNSKLVIDGTGKYLIPGLSEMHYHLRSNKRGIEKDLKLMIANGITTARNMGEYSRQDHISIRNKIRSGELMGPNYYTTGPYLQTQDLPDIETVIKIVKEHKEKGYDYLKIGDGYTLPKDIYLKILEEAEKQGVVVIGHAQHSLPLEYSLRMKSIEHVEEFVYTLHKEGVMVEEGVMIPAVLNYETSFLNKAAEQIKKSGIYVAPTIVVIDYITQYIDDEKFELLKKDETAIHLNIRDSISYLTEDNEYRMNFKGKEINGMKFEALFEEYLKWMKVFTKVLSDHEVPLLTGSDTFGMVIVGYSLHQEFVHLQEIGLSPFQVLKASTVTAAKYLDAFDLEGTISEGKNANLVLLNKNPLEDIKNTTTIEGVMLKGEWLDRARLDAMLKESATRE